LAYEVFTLIAVFSLPTAFLFSFPASSVRFRANPVRQRQPFTCAFINLTPEQSAAAISATRTSWMVEERDARRMKGRLHIGELPVMDPPVAPYISVSASEAGRAVYDFPSLPPTLGAGEPERIAGDSEEKKPERPQTFSREEMLEL
jgi:hypothetical protein